MSRLTSATNPDSGTATYSYFKSGTALPMLQSRTDATNVTTTYYYDAYGNGWVAGATGSTGLPGNAPQEIGMAYPASGATTPYTATNQLKSVGYDGAGNETSFRGNTLAYDAENRVSSVKSSSGTVLVSYQYDGDGKRITKTTPSGTTNYVYDAPGRLMAEYVNEVLSKEYIRMHSEFIPSSTELVAIENAPGSGAPCSTCYVITDDLGNLREMADGLGNTIARHDYLPFGEEALTNSNRPASVGFDSGDGAAQRFTGKERDAESGLDYFGARYYGSALGRFTSPDWSAKPQAVPYVDLKNPQSLNLYNYMRNNPLGGVDPDGHDTQQTLTDDQVRSVSSDITAVQKFANEHPILTNLLINGAMMILSRGEAGSGARVEPSEVNAGTASGLTPGKEVSPSVNPSEVIGKTPAEIDGLATGKGLIPKGPDPMNGKGAYVDPVTGQRRVLSHPEAETPHAHVNNPSGERLGPDGTVVAPESPAAHLPIKKPQP